MTQSPFFSKSNDGYLDGHGYPLSLPLCFQTKTKLEVDIVRERERERERENRFWQQFRRMGRLILHCFTILHMAALLLSSGSSIRSRDESYPSKPQESSRISTKQMDITTPITTLPTPNNNPSSSSSLPTTTTPMLNPTNSNSDQSSSPTIMNPANPQFTNPLATNSPTPSSGSWCIASSSISQAALQLALDFACGRGGADCAPIQQGGACYSPATLRSHASYAFNSYYQRNPIPTSCNFGGTAVTTSIDPSYDTCQYPTTSTSSSLLNITNSSGSRVFGGGRPVTPSISGGARERSMAYLFYILGSLVILYFVM